MLLVTGGMGFIGMHVVQRLLEAGERVVATWHYSWRVPEFWGDELGKRVLAERLDVASTLDVLNLAKQHQVDGILHLATPVVGTATPAQDFATNLHGLVNVLEAARLVGARRVTFASTSTLYSGLKAGPFREDAPLPIESRSATEAFKKACETLLFHYADRIGVSVVAVRPRQVYGPMYYSGINLPSRLCRAAVRGVEPDYGRTAQGPNPPPFAQDTSDFTYVKDCAEVLTLVHQADQLQHRVYNVGGGRAVTMAEVVDAVKEMVPDARIELRPGSSPGNDSRDAYLDLTRVQAEFGFTPRYPVERGIPEYITWLRTHDT